MGSNDSSQTGGARERIRARIFWPVGLLLTAVVVVFVFFRVHRENASQGSSKPLTSSNETAGTDARGNGGQGKTSPGNAATTTDAETARLISQLFDKSLSLQLRRQAAKALAKLGTDEAMAALKMALNNDSPAYLKVAIAEGLGQCPNVEASALLKALASGTNETLARGAVRGLALRGDADAVDVLTGLLFNEQTPMGVRTEAALGLGDVSLPAAQDALTRAVSQIQDPDVLESVLDGLGRRPFSETQEFFGNYLNSPDVPPESKVLAIEADAEGDVAPFLLKYVNDPDPEVRAAAATALATAESDTDFGPQLLKALGQGTDPKVRAQLYAALAAQQAGDAQGLLTLVQSETDPAAQLAGLECLANGLQSSPDALAYFNGTAVPELEKVALGTGDLQDKLDSLMALGRAKTPDSLNALRQVAQQSPDTRIAGVARTLLQSAGS